MKPLDRSLVEKSGYDNGFEVVQESSEAVVRMASSRHPVIVEITEGSHEGSWKLRFSDTLDIHELKRDLNKPMFPPDEISPWDRQTLAVILRRASELGIALPDTPVNKFKNKLIAFLEANPSVRGTEQEQMVKQRIGQNIYRDALMNYWKYSCAVTSINVPQLLKASHAKPWKDCETDADRLNIYNGFLFSANLDSLFDSGLISFSDSGEILFSPSLSETQLSIIGIQKNAHLRWTKPRHFLFLRWHREKVFRI
jgi:hypothetical protein